ncbi:MAG TPA: HAD family phosphatase [Thiotrichales bacterium]|nr:HAD family phosphatase [Thiotrichales bacterium]
MPPPSPIRAVLLDFGGVIAEEGFRNGLIALSREQGLDPDRTLSVAREAIYDSGFVLGKGSEAAFWKMMREGAGLRGEDETLRQRILEGFVLRPWMLERVREWRARGLVTGILSDQTWWLDRLEERDRFFHHFDHVFNSYHLGKGKRDPSLFRNITARLGLQPGEILFVDDAPSNVQRARDAGWHAIRYLDRPEFERQIEELLPAG